MVESHNVDEKRVIMLEVMGDSAVLVYERLIQLHLHQWYSLNHEQIASFDSG